MEHARVHACCLALHPVNVWSLVVAQRAAEQTARGGAGGRTHAHDARARTCLVRAAASTCVHFTPSSRTPPPSLRGQGRTPAKGTQQGSHDPADGRELRGLQGASGGPPLPPPHLSVVQGGGWGPAAGAEQPRGGGGTPPPPKRAAHPPTLTPTRRVVATVDTIAATPPSSAPAPRGARATFAIVH